MTNFRRKPNRLSYYNYSQTGYYFVTVCVCKHLSFFGKIENEQIRLSKVGLIAQQCWQQIPAHFANVLLDEFIIMPNHMHGIVIVEDITVGDNHGCTATNKQTLPKVISQYKSSVTRITRRRQNNPNFAWQRSFYDRVIRNQQELINIRAYIQNNPLKWAFDKYNPVNFSGQPWLPSTRSANND